MSLVNFTTREITCKIVYYGPGRSGKTSNLQYIYGRVPESRRGRMVSLATQTDRTLFCSDLLHQVGEWPAVTEKDVIGVSRESLLGYQKGPFANYLPYTAQTPVLLERMAALEPRTCAIMHGSVYRGDGRRALRDFSQLLKEVFAG